MKYKVVVSTLFLVLNTLDATKPDTTTTFVGQSWVERYSDENLDSHSPSFLDVGRSLDMQLNGVRENDSTVIKTISTSENTNLSPQTTQDPQESPISRGDIYPDNELKKYVKATKASGLISLYEGIGYKYIWLDKTKPKQITKELFEMIKNDQTLPNTSTSKKKLKTLSKRVKKLYAKALITPKQKALLDMELSKLYLNYAYYKVYGGINWSKFEDKLKELTEKYKIKVGWEYYRPPKSPTDILLEGYSTGALKETLQASMPKRFKFKKLEKKLIEYLKLAQKGGWKQIPKFKKVRPNRKSPIVPVIRNRLKLEDEARKCPTPSDETLYDQCLQKAVFRYKIRHGIKANKMIDSSLRKILNIPISKKIAMMRLNLDRIKWLYRDEEPLRIELNIPSFRLNLYDKNKIITTIRVIVGRPDHPTPIFHNVMKYVVINPYWKIPESIVKHEMLKHLVKDPYYYERRGKVLKKSWDENSPDVDPGKVNWRKYYKNRDKEDMHIPYYFMQLPGSRNALGKIKFLFPNKYSVYIHDTPSKRLFFRTDRAFSHGCMRIQKPRELLKMLALYNENIDVEKIMKKLGTRKKETISLVKTVPVDITYLTAYVDDYDNLHFRKDIYKYDKYQFENYKYPDLIGRKSNKEKKKNQKKGKQKK